MYRNVSPGAIIPKLVEKMHPVLKNKSDLSQHSFFLFRAQQLVSIGVIHLTLPLSTRHTKKADVFRRLFSK